MSSNSWSNKHVSILEKLTNANLEFHGRNKHDIRLGSPATFNGSQKALQKIRAI